MVDFICYKISFFSDAVRSASRRTLTGQESFKPDSVTPRRDLSAFENRETIGPVFENHFGIIFR
jgi:hypothetical protein